MAERPQLHPIGWVRSELVDRAKAPKMSHEGAPPAWLDLDDDVAPGLADIRAGDRLLVLTWLHEADRSVRVVHPRDDVSNPLRGVFSTRSADRPNPVGLHPVTVLEVDGTHLHVDGLEAVDGTPVVDLKPDLAPPPL